jgi:hypothetical protein
MRISTYIEDEHGLKKKEEKKVEEKEMEEKNSGAKGYNN